MARRTQKKKKSAPRHRVVASEEAAPEESEVRRLVPEDLTGESEYSVSQAQAIETGSTRRRARPETAREPPDPDPNELARLYVEGATGGLEQPSREEDEPDPVRMPNDDEE